MRPKERRDNGQTDLLRSRLDAIIDMAHPLVKLAQTIDWSFLEQKFGAVYEDKPGRPPLPTRLMAGLAILKHTHDLSDEVLCERWVENPYYQFFCGELSFCHKLPFDRSSLTHWRQRLGEEQLVALIQESLSVAHKTGALATCDLERVVVDTTMQPKRSRTRPMRGCAIAHWKNWWISRGAITCHCGRATGASPSAPQSWSGATRMRTSSGGPGARSSFCAFAWAA